MASQSKKVHLGTVKSRPKKGFSRSTRDSSTYIECHSPWLYNSKNITDDPFEVTCKVCRKTERYRKLANEPNTHKWIGVRCNSSSFKLGPSLKDGRRQLKITTIPVTPEEASVIVDTQWDRIPEYLCPPKQEKTDEDSNHRDSRKKR